MWLLCCFLMLMLMPAADRARGVLVHGFAGAPGGRGLPVGEVAVRERRCRCLGRNLILRRGGSCC